MKVWENCGACGQDVQIESEHGLQKCPECLENILPCSVCYSMNCGECSDGSHFDMYYTVIFADLFVDYQPDHAHNITTHIEGDFKVSVTAKNHIEAGKQAVEFLQEQFMMNTIKDWYQIECDTTGETFYQ